MKIIEAMKKTKDLYIKANDLRDKIGANSADHDYQTPVYPDQAGMIRGWLQAHSDIIQEIGSLQLAISRTNLSTSVTITLGDKQVTKTIAEWLYRRGPKDKKGTASLDLAAWSKLTDRNLKEGAVELVRGNEPIVVKIRRYFDPIQRDKMIELYRSEPSLIDAALEVANATTDLITT